MPLRRAIGISLACLVTSACATGQTLDESTSPNPGGTADVRQQNAEAAADKFRGLAPEADACGDIRDGNCGLLRPVGRSQFGKAAWYDLVGNRTANGEILDRVSATAAHRTLPLASFAKVTNLDNGCSVIVKINDRGPYTRGRILDLSPRAADELDMKRAGVAAVVVEPLVNRPAATVAAFQTSETSMTQ
jgi:rare lipoprotein A